MSPTIIALLIAAGGYLVRHLDLLSTALGWFGIANPLHAPDVPAATLKSQIVAELEAIAKAAGAKAAADVMANGLPGTPSQFAAEVQAVVAAAAQKAVADLKAKLGVQ